MSHRSPDVDAIARRFGLGTGATLTHRGMWDVDGLHRRVSFAGSGSGGRNWMPIPSLRGLDPHAPGADRAAAALIRAHLEQP